MKSETPIISNPEEKMSASFGAAFFLIPHFMNKKTEFVTMYMKQNFVITLAFIVLQIIIFIAGMLFPPKNIAAISFDSTK